MCWAIPARVLEIEGDGQAAVEVAGRRRPATLHLLPEVKVGDYVLLYLGCGVAKIEEEEALEVLNLWREMAVE